MRLELQQNRELISEEVRSCFLRTSFLAALALGNDGRFQPGSQIIREGIEFRIAVDFDGLLGRVADHVAVVAPSQMVFQFYFRSIVNDAVQVVG